MGRKSRTGKAAHRDHRVSARNARTYTYDLGEWQMAVVTILNEDRKLTDVAEITANLATHGIDYERWTPSHPISDDASPEAILDAYSREIESLKERGGYVTADVIDVSP